MFKVNPHCVVSKVNIKGDSNFFYVVDDFLIDPQDVIAFAKQTAYFDPVGTDQTFYPGVRDKMPAPYGRNLVEWFKPIVSELYFSSAEVKSYSPLCKLSLVTLKPDELNDQQKIPHIDSASENEFAFVHYLCDATHGGTSLYRYKPTGAVKISTSAAQLTHEMCQAAKATPEEHGGYLNGDTSLFERVAQVEAKFNRLVFYKSNLLHCADINSGHSYNKSVETGRLSVASFLYFEEV